MRLGTGWGPGYKIEPYPTISRENFIYFTSDVPGNRRKPGASQISVDFFNENPAGLAPGFRRFSGTSYIKYMKFSREIVE